MIRIGRGYRIGIGVLICVIAALALNYRLSRPFGAGLNNVEQALRATLGCTEPVRTDGEYGTVLVQLTELERIRDENEQLREQLAFSKRIAYNQRIANVRSRDPLNPSLLYIDIGSDDGIKVGQAVTVGEGIMVGRIAQLTPNTALVELLTNDATRLAVRTLDAVRTEGMLRGYLGAAIRMEYVETNTELTVGDIITTSGLEGTIPRGLVVGSIAKIERDPNQLFTRSDISPAADYSKLFIVAVITQS